MMFKHNKQEKLIKQYEEFINKSEFFFSYLDNEKNTFVNSVLKDTKEILFNYHTSFQFERKGNSREGALTYKRVDNKNRLLKVIKIRKDVEFISQLHTYFHELVHLVNNHSRQDKNEIQLTRPQREYVAEVGAQYLLYSFTGKRINDLPSNEKWEQNEYINLWIKNSLFGDEKIKEMWKQINFSVEYIVNIIKKNKNNFKKKKKTN